MPDDAPEIGRNRRMLDGEMKYMMALLLAAVVLYLVVVNFSTVESRFECVGKTSAEGRSEPATFYIKLTEYRWWVGLCNESAGTFHLEIPNTLVDYSGEVAKVGDQFQIRDQKKLKGNFSSLSKTLALATPIGFFDGTCTPIK